MISFFKGTNQVFAVATKETISHENCEKLQWLFGDADARSGLRRLSTSVARPSPWLGRSRLAARSTLSGHRGRSVPRPPRCGPGSP